MLRQAVGDAEKVVALLEQGVLVEGRGPTQVRFARPSQRAKILAAIPWSRRRQHLAALGEAARELRLPPQDIAPFFEAAQQPAVARGWWLKAAEKACTQGAYAQALAWLDRALVLWPWNELPDERVRVLRETARCAANAGKVGPAQRAWEELADYAADARQPALQVEALQHLAGLASDAACISDWLRQAAEVAERDLPPPEAVRQLLLYVDNLASRVRVANATAVLGRAVRLTERARDPALLSEVRGWQGLLAAMAGDQSRAKQLVEESLRLAVEHDLAEQAALAYRRRANIRDYGGQYPEVKQAHHAAIEFCRRTRAGGELACLGCLAYACFRTGDWQEAIQSARAVTRDAREVPALRAMGACVLGLVAAFRGERGPAMRHLEAALQQFRHDGFAGMEFFALWGQGYLRYADGDRAGAAATFDQVRALWRDTDDVHDVVPALLFAGGTYAEERHPERLADCLDIVGQVLRRNPLGEARAALLALQAEQAQLEGRRAEAGEAFLEAARQYTALGLPVEQLWIESRLIQGTLRSHDGPTSAAAVALAKRLGMRPLLTVLQGRGTNEASEGSDLTPRQQSVLQHLARGLTSKEIADRLGLSTRTVEMHVSRLLQRLNCRTRPEAIRHAMERGWLPSK